MRGSDRSSSGVFVILVTLPTETGDLDGVDRLALSAFAPRHAVGQLAKTVAKEEKPLTSIGLPDGSRKNMVHCSPG